MSPTAHALNPFMLMLNPELVIAAVEKSERLGQLNRHLCRPLDRPVGVPGAPGTSLDDDEGDSADDTEQD